MVGGEVGGILGTYIISRGRKDLMGHNGKPVWLNLTDFCSF